MKKPCPSSKTWQRCGQVSMRGRGTKGVCEISTAPSTFRPRGTRTHRAGGGSLYTAANSCSSKHTPSCSSAWTARSNLRGKATGATWRGLRRANNNPLEHLLREVRRRTRAVVAFPDGKSALMLDRGTIASCGRHEVGHAAVSRYEPTRGSERSGMNLRAKTFGSPSGEPNTTTTRPISQQKGEKLWTLPGQLRSRAHQTAPHPVQRLDILLLDRFRGDEAHL